MFSFNDLGVLGVNHFGLATSDLDAALDSILQIPGSRLLRGPAENHVQQVRYAFVETGRGVIELLEPLGSESPITRIVSTGGGVYHICFEVDSMDEIERHMSMESRSWVVAPLSDPAFDGRKIGFVLDENLGLIEFVESRPLLVGRTVNPIKNTSTAKKSNFVNEESDRKALSAIVIDIVARVLVLDPTEVDETTGAGSTLNWDSLAQLQILVQLESIFSINVPAIEIGNLSNVGSIIAYLEKRKS